MNYYWFNRQEILQKAKEKNSNLSEEEKDKIKEYQNFFEKNQELVQYKKDALKNK